MLPLIPHPAHPPRAVRSVHAQIIATPDGGLMVRYRVEGIDALVIPPFSGRGRADELWRTTCFEMFAQGDGTGYREYNFSPSGRWAAYRFTAPRERMRDFDPATYPEIVAQEGETMLVVTVTLDGKELVGIRRAALTAVIEEEGGQTSFWALSHGADRPDFHDPACFALTLGAAGGA